MGHLHRLYQILHRNFWDLYSLPTFLSLSGRFFKTCFRILPHTKCFSNFLEIDRDMAPYGLRSSIVRLSQVPSFKSTRRHMAYNSSVTIFHHGENRKPSFMLGGLKIQQQPNPSLTCLPQCYQWRTPVINRKIKEKGTFINSMKSFYFTMLHELWE
jgi:hypothetical protein